MMTKRDINFTGNNLKAAAAVTMVIDHVAEAVLERGFGASEAGGVLELAYTLMRLIGRLAFPIFAFLLVEGALKTRSRKKYALRLFLMGLVSEIPFDLALLAGNRTLSTIMRGQMPEGEALRYLCGHQNVFFTLLLGLLMIAFCEHFKDNRYLVPASMLIFSLPAILLACDYDWIGIVLIFILYYYRSDKEKQIRYGAIFSLVQFTAPAAFLLIRRYNGEKGKSRMRWFYFFYAGHLIILVLIRIWLIAGGMTG